MTLTLCQEFGDKVAYFAFLIQYSKLIADVFFLVMIHLIFPLARASGTRWMLCHLLSSRLCLPWSPDEAYLSVT